MKTIETENKKQKYVTVQTRERSTSRNGTLEKVVMLILLIFLVFAVSKAEENTIESKWQYVFSSGVHSFYAPVENLKWDNPGWVISAGGNRMMGQKQYFSVGLQLQFAQQEFLGSASVLQVLGQFHPVVFKKIELGIGTGAGYRLSTYPYSTFNWDGTSWNDGKKYKGMVQIPLQLSIAYRSLSISSYKVIPFISYQLQAMFGYNPDFDPLPDSNFMAGFKFQFRNN